MSKVNTIRKKALEQVRKQNWDGAVREYKRLAELDQSNPNVFNELGDIYLKIGNKTEAYESFVRAIDAYTRVSLHNNAVAVCKKVLRLIPTRIEVLTKLGLIRKKQGLGKEAESYYLSFFNKLVNDQQADAAGVAKHCVEAADEMHDSYVVLERALECVAKFNRNEEAGQILVKLEHCYHKQAMPAELQDTRRRMGEMGIESSVLETPPSEHEKEGPVVTEENIWSADAHTEGERIDVGAEPAGTAPVAEGTPGPTASADPGSVAMGEEGETQTDEGSAPTQTMTQEPPETKAEPEREATGDQPAAETPESNEPVASSFEDDVAGATGADGDEKPGVHVSAIIDELKSDSADALSEEDYRSHYDLGMAYLEMDLIPEAIREYQFASKSSQYQTRSLEMIGLCFLKQNQPRLAVKQLERGLQLIGDTDADALGIKYNLGLAYEMLGEIEKAKAAFEDVYVEDVTFREVADKIQKYS